MFVEGSNVVCGKQRETSCLLLQRDDEILHYLCVEVESHRCCQRRAGGCDVGHSYLSKRGKSINHA